MPKYRSQTFTNVREIDAFFQKLGAKGFADWFNSNIAGRQNWGEVRLQSPSNWNKVWTSANIIFNKETFNLIEFLCINSIMMNETGGSFTPLTERVGNTGHPGISYAFDKISGLKLGYNTLNTNKTAYDLFKDSNFKNAHVNKPLGKLLKDTSDTRWQGNTFPQGFSGNVSNETSVSGKTNTFLTEADFVKFRGRGYIQTTGRTVYFSLIDFVLKYTGGNSVINRIKGEWSKYNGNKDVIASVSTNQQWDDLFQKTESIIGNYAVYVHANAGGAKGKKNYHWINSDSSDSILSKDIKDVAYCVAGGGATSYANKFYGRVMQQLNLIEATEAGPVAGGATASTGPATSGQAPTESTQDQSREERTGEDPNSSSPKTEGEIKSNIINVFQATLKAKEIKFDLPPQKDQQKETAESLGNFPFIWYNAYQIEYTDISYFKLSTNNNLPSIKLVFYDTHNLMKDKGFPLDDSKISLFLNPRSQQLKPIHMDFKITNFSVNGGTYTIGGVIDADKLYVKNFKSLSKMTSFEALKSLAQEIGLGFNTNIDNTDDKMTWINTGQRIYEFIDSIVETSYKSDETYLLSYIDYYYNLTYVDLEKELSRDIKEELGVANIGLEEISKIDDKERVSRLYLSNDSSLQNTNSFFIDYRVINNSTSVSLREGYLTKVKFYDELRKDFLVFDVDSITSKGDTNIIMKGSPQDESFFKQNVNLVYTGKLDVDNMHKNYHYSYIQNQRNISELQKIGIEVSMKTPNYNLYRFQKIFVNISNQTSTPSAPQTNNRLSGEWFIIDIIYTFDGKTYKQTVKLIKRELDLSPEELKNEGDQNSTNGDSSGTSENTSNDNTSDGATNPTPENPGEASGLTSSTPVDDTGFPLTKEIFRSIYKGKVNDKVIEQYYAPMKDAMIKYSINTKERIAAFLSQVNAETGNLIYSSELATGQAYEGRTDLGNTQPGDGKKFKGRGLVQLTGRNNYKKAGDFFKRDYLSNTTVVAADNETHRKGAASAEQIQNTILTSVRYWLKGSAWGNLNDYADKMNIKKPMNLGSSSVSALPNSHATGKQYGTKRNNNFSTRYSPNDANFTNFTLICFGVNGGYNGYQERVKNWIEIREYFK